MGFILRSKMNSRAKASSARGLSWYKLWHHPVPYPVAGIPAVAVGAVGDKFQSPGGTNASTSARVQSISGRTMRPRTGGTPCNPSGPQPRVMDSNAVSMLSLRVWAVAIFTAPPPHAPGGRPPPPERHSAPPDRLPLRPRNVRRPRGPPPPAERQEAPPRRAQAV